MAEFPRVNRINGKTKTGTASLSSIIGDMLRDLLTAILKMVRSSTLKIFFSNNLIREIYHLRSDLIIVFLCEFCILFLK